MRARLDLRSERGFTLIELLIAMATGLVVSSAALAIVVVALHFSSSNQDRIDANRQGRIAMQRIVQALDSSCVAAQTPPIVAGSTPTSISFYTSGGNVSLGDGSSLNPNLVTVSWAGTAGSPLIMQTATWKTGTGPSSWTFNTPTSFTLMAHANYFGASSTNPMFSYYGYTSGSGGTMSTTAYTATGTGGLSAANAATTAMVQIQFEALPSNGNATNNRGANFQNSIVLRLSPASGAASATNSPCT